MNKFEYLFKNPKAYTTCLMQAVLDMFGVEIMPSFLQKAPEADLSFLDWAPETMEMELTRELGFTPSDSILDKIQAGSSLLITNLFHREVGAFSTVCQVLSRGIPPMPGFVPAGLEDIAWGVTEANLLEGPDFWKEGFSDDVARYVGFILENHGLLSSIPILRFAKISPETELKANEAMSLDPDLHRFSQARIAESKKELQIYVVWRNFWISG